jgi:hypothetical protein
MGCVDHFRIRTYFLIHWTSPRPSPKEREVHGLKLLHDFFLHVIFKIILVSFCVLVVPSRASGTEVVHEFSFVEFRYSAHGVLGRHKTERLETIDFVHYFPNSFYSYFPLSI